MTFFVQQKVFNSIPQEGLEMYFTRKFTYEKAPMRAELTHVFIESVMYKYLATVEAGRDYEAAFELAQEATLVKVLQSEALGGKPEWSLEDFLTVRTHASRLRPSQPWYFMLCARISRMLCQADVWEQCGGHAGLKEVSKKFITLIAAGGQKVKPINPICGTCGELTALHKGDRLNLAYMACSCKEVPAADLEENELNRRSKPTFGTEPPPKRTRGFDAELDPMGQGIYETYTRKCAAATANSRAVC
jgi:hypothetical protein